MNNIFESVTNRKIKPSSPGEVLLDILDSINISQTKFADILGVSRRTINQIVQGHRPITVDMAIRIGIALGNGPELWLNLQQKVDLWNALQEHKDQYEKILKISYKE
jgi:antitoxin HigA-1